MGVGIGVQGGNGLCSPPLRSDKEYLMLVYSRPLILLFCRGENTGKVKRWEHKKKATMKKCGVICCTPVPPLCVSAMFLCSAVQPYRWICTAPQSAPSQIAENEPSGWSLERRCRSPPLQRENNISHLNILRIGSIAFEVNQPDTRYSHTCVWD